MILIWDNGGEYSDHAIYFVDVPPEKVPAVDEVLTWLSSAKPPDPAYNFVDQGYIIGWSDEVRWRDDVAYPFDQFMDSLWAHLPVFALSSEDLAHLKSSLAALGWKEPA